MKMKTLINTLSLAVVLFTIIGCGETKENETSADSVTTTITSESATHTDGYSEIKNAYFGNLHIHTSWSFDGYTNGSVTDPEDAYRWALGEAIPGGGGGGDMQIKVPLDWYAVSDHAEYMGVFKQMENPNSPISKLDIAKEVTSGDPAVALAAFTRVLDGMNKGISDPDLSDPKLAKTIWQEIIKTADEYNDPGKFTTFSAFEWTSAPNNRNLHRVVLFKNSKGIPALPYSTLDSDKPEDLWKYMNEARENGATLLAVPHNGNASDGLMFSLTDSYGNPISKEYSEARMLNEPLYEISQIKGTSETHPDLSPNDEFANFEQWDYTLSAKVERPTKRKGSFLRQAYLDGLKFESKGAGNPFKYGIIGDSDSHNSASSNEEDNYTGKFAVENNPDHRLNGVPGFPEGNKQQIREFGSAGLAGVWAEENTRDAIYNALLNKETFGTSGTRTKVRFFGSFDYKQNITSNKDWIANAYANGVPMGSDLKKPNGKSPIFIIHAIKEANGANLDRAQIIKGWVDDKGESHEKIYNVALSDGRKDGSVAVGNTVDLKTAKYTNDIGDVEFLTTWMDPEFDAAQHAFYYVRVLEIPTPRWSTYDAVKLGIPVRTDIASTIQERAWSSPIWYTPK
ncbi:MAG: hypothetical protein ACI9FN_001538 [Saprospiraceae bacterium]|jgi:hypothetical protein